MKSDAMDVVFRALGSESRRRILDIVKDGPGCSVNHVAGFFDESRINVMKHLRVLEEAGLVHSEKQGRTRKLYFNCVPIQMIHERWTTEYSAMWAGQLTRVKYRVESKKGK
jgi:predicted transcriptional regulator